MGDILARVSDPDRVAKAAAELKVIMSDTLDRIAANAAAGIGPKPGPGPESGEGKEGSNEPNRSHSNQGAYYQ